MVAQVFFDNFFYGLRIAFIQSILDHHKIWLRQCNAGTALRNPKAERHQLARMNLFAADS
jgi:hypothetical protein